MLIVDVHAHMDYENFNNDIDEVIKDSIEKNVKAIISNGTDSNSNRRVLALSKRYSIIKAALGIYPTDVLNLTQEEIDFELKFIEEKIKSKECIAIGEVGLDYKVVEDLTEEKKEKMKSTLVKFCKLSKKYDIPIILHTRGAELDTIELLEKEEVKKVVMHCFSGRKHLITRIRDNKWFTSIPVNVVKSQQFQTMTDIMPLSQILTETDAPFLGPTKDERNDSRNIILTLNKIAEIKKMNVDEVSNIVYANYQKLFL